VVVVVLVAIAVAVLAIIIVNRPDGRVHFIGDSITDQAKPALVERFDIPDGNVASISGATIDQMLEHAAQVALDEPDQVVINLGTNDVLATEDAATNAALIQQMASHFTSARCIHVVTINEHMFATDGRDLHGAAVALNQRLRALAGQHQWRVIDWAAIVIEYDASGSPRGPLTDDTVHPTALGEQMLLDAYEASLSSC
jgi:lysophospholipase L1-like esterase